MSGRRRSTRGPWWSATAGGTCCAGATRRRPSRVPHRPGHRGRPTRRTFVPPADLDPVAELETHLAAGWEYATDVLVEAPLETVSGSSRAGSAGSRRGPRAAPGWSAARATRTWYAEQLAVLPVPFRIVNGPERALPRSRSPVACQTPQLDAPGGSARCDATRHTRAHGAERLPPTARRGLPRGRRQAQHLRAGTRGRRRRARGRSTRSARRPRSARPTGARATSTHFRRMVEAGLLRDGEAAVDVARAGLDSLHAPDAGARPPRRRGAPERGVRRRAGGATAGDRDGARHRRARDRAEPPAARRAPARRRPAPPARRLGRPRHHGAVRGRGGPRP